MNISKTFVAVVICIMQLFLVTSAFAISEEEKTFLSMYFKDDELVVLSATRSLKSITRVAENISVITKDDIELMNAHTLADVLYKINGVQVRQDGGPGAISLPFIQGSEFRHISVFMDGILLNASLNNLADIAMVPVQHIEKIEVIKGPASSVWGTSLGGVINIITKAGVASKRSGGTLSCSLGEQTFLDSRAELYGSHGKIGYYFYAGRLQADGFSGIQRNSGSSFNNYYLKISHALSNDTEMIFTTFYSTGSRGNGYPDMGYLSNAETDNLLASLSLNTSLNDALKLSLSARTAMRDWRQTDTYADGSAPYNLLSKDSAYGASAKLTWNANGHTAVGGFDFDNGIMKNYETDIDDFRARIDKWAIYVNDSIQLGKLSVTPGLRYDHDGYVGSFVSPSLGVTYEVCEKTLLRAFVARGFSAVPVAWATDTIPYGYKGNPELKPERVMSYQVGLETGIMKYLWLKTSAFRHDIKDAVVQEEIVDDPVYAYTYTNKGEVRRQGIEAEIKTIPFYHFTLSAGGTFIHVKDMLTGETVHDIPNNTYDLSIKYDDEKSLKGLLTGHYIWWDSTRNGQYSSFIFDLNLIKRIYKEEQRKAEIFFTGHNLFNGEQHPSRYLTPQRWIEAGVRFKF